MQILRKQDLGRTASYQAISLLNLRWSDVDPARSLCGGTTRMGGYHGRKKSSSRPKARDSLVPGRYSTRNATIGSIREALRAGK